MNPTFLKVGDILAIHANQIQCFGGSIGVRDMGLLRSAAGQPSASFGGVFLHADLFEMAAAYLFSLVKNHPFVDGNKRVGAAVALDFLEMNGAEIAADNDELVAMVLGVAQSVVDKAAVAEFFRTRSTAI